MVFFFKTSSGAVIAVEADHSFAPEESEKLLWLFGNATQMPETSLAGWFVGPRKEMITPWSTNAVEITQNMGLSGISRIEEFSRWPAAMLHTTRCCKGCMMVSMAMCSE